MTEKFSQGFREIYAPNSLMLNYLRQSRVTWNLDPVNLELATSYPVCFRSRALRFAIYNYLGKTISSSAGDLFRLIGIYLYLLKELNANRMEDVLRD